ncbi:hypothetical protein ACOMHN_020862 [Nucella lapillus]
MASLAKFLKPISSKHKEGTRNEWRWDWLDQKVNDVRVGDVFRKLDDKGYLFCVPCGKKMSYANRGLIALKTHMARKAHIKNTSAVKDNATNGFIGSFGPLIS